jgi:hypothetical protein
MVGPGGVWTGACNRDEAQRKKKKKKKKKEVVDWKAFVARKE